LANLLVASATQFEAVLIWSHQPASGIETGRQFKAFNRVFEEEPTDEQLASVVAEKQRQIEATPHAFPDPAMHRMELRKVAKYDLPLEYYVDLWNQDQPEE